MWDKRIIKEQDLGKTCSQSDTRSFVDEPKISWMGLHIYEYNHGCQSDDTGILNVNSPFKDTRKLKLSYKH